MDTRIALIGIIVEDMNSTDKLNNILHEYSHIWLGEWVYLTEKRM